VRERINRRRNMGPNREVQRLKSENSSLKANEGSFKLMIEDLSSQVLQLQAEVKRLREACKIKEWLISELQMFKNRPEFNKALDKIEQALSPKIHALNKENK